jgi:hypothetical protein
MDKEVLRRRLRERFEAALDGAVAAVEGAPDGQWVAGSEWQVREVFQKLMADCFRDVLQARADAHPTASQAAFSPSSPCGRGGPAAAAEQGGALGAGADGRG